MKDYSLRDEKSRLIQATATSLHEHITELFDNGYDQGYEDGKKASCDCKDSMEAEYNRGLNEAWEAAKKIVHDKGLSLQELKQIFNTTKFDRILIENTASEAIAMIKEYEEKKKLKIGDGVITENGNKGVVIATCEDGTICVWFPTCNHVQMYPLKDLSKTSRHFDQIAEVLAEMRGESE